METNQEFDFETFKREAIKGMYEGKPFNGEKGIFAPLMKHFLESAIEGELDFHLKEEKAKGEENRRNGRTVKRVKSLSGEFNLETSRDRASTFEPMILPKRQVIITEELEDKVIGLYSRGVSTRDISQHIKEMYQMDISATQLSSITDKVIPAMNEWRTRSLQSVYPFVYLDCMHYKVRESGRVVTRAIYNILGVDIEGKKDLIGMYDGLKGFPEAIATVFPLTQIQTCVVHQIRNSLRYVAEKDKKEFVADLKPVYQAVSKESGFENLLKLDEKWNKKYPVPIQSWYNNWGTLSTFFEYDDQIRKVIYTTNTVEGFHRQVRKVTKTKGAFTSDNALMKLVYLVVLNISEKWTMPLHNWSLTLSQLYVIFGERLKLHLSN